MHSAFTGVQVLVTRTPEHAHWLVHFCGSFLLGFTYCDGRETKRDRNMIFKCSFIGYFFLGFHIVKQGTRFYVWLWYKSERTPKHSAIWLILGGYAPSYKSDSLVFRCSFYYKMYFISGKNLRIFLHTKVDMFTAEFKWITCFDFYKFRCW
jgi:hypothetical protein